MRLLIYSDLVERGLILTPQQVDGKTNEINAISPVLAALARRGGSLPLMP